MSPRSTSVILLATLTACVEPPPSAPTTDAAGHRPAVEDPFAPRMAPDPCNAFVAVNTCEADGAGACGWFGEAGCIALFGRVIGEVDDVGDEPLLDLGDRFVTLDELATAPLTEAERLAAASHRASITRSFAPETAEAELHSSSYCGHGSTTSTCNVVGHWSVSYLFRTNRYCGTSQCHDHKYFHQPFLCNSDDHPSTRTCANRWH